MSAPASSTADRASADGLLQALATAGLDSRGLLAIADALPIMVAYVDDQLRYTFCNQAVADFFERPRSEILGRSVEDLLGAAAFDLRRAAFAKALGGTRQRIVAALSHPTRGTLTTQADYIPHRGKTGSVEGIVLIIVDVTEQRAAEVALKESEGRFRRIADSAPVPVFVTRRDTTLDFANAEFLHLFQLPGAADFDWKGRIHPDDWPIFAPWIEGQEPERDTLRLTGRLLVGETYRWFEISAQSRRDGEGRRLGHIGAAVDVTLAKQAELALQRQVDERTRQLDENQGRFRAIFDSVMTLLVLMDPDGRILEVNNTPAPWRSVRMLESIGGMLWDAPTVQDHPEVIPTLRDMVAEAQQGRNVRREVPLVREGVTVAWLDAMLQPVIGPDGRPGHLLLEARDITDLRNAQDQLRQSQKMEALGQLTGGIAHDFNNLLTVVVGGLDLIAKVSTDEVVLRYATNALAAAERGARLTGQLLAFSRVQRLDARPVDMAAVIDEIRPLLRNVLGPGIKKVSEIEEGMGLIMADPTQLEVAILNLAINARDAMPDGGTLRIVARRCRVSDDVEVEDGDYVELVISDTGTGMPQDVVDRAFEPFFTTKETGKGTGLGLSMVYGMARQSGGTATIESRHGEGTAVRLLFRMADELGLPLEAVRSADTVRSGQPRRARILVVDDDTQVREHIETVLKGLGHDVVAVGDGQHALDMAEEFDPELVILDFVMPGLSGADVARAMLDQRPGQRLLFISGYNETAAIRAVAPSAPLLSKPFRPEALEAVLGEIDWPSEPGDAPGR